MILESGEAYELNAYRNIGDHVNAAQFYFGPRGKGCISIGQNIIASILSETITYEMIENYNQKVIFDLTPWLNIVNNHSGKLPIVVRSVPEGSYVEKGEAAITVDVYGNENIWIGCFIENLIYQSMWYTSTVASKIAQLKNMLAGFGVDHFFAHYGRGASSTEQAAKSYLCHNLLFNDTNPIATMLDCYDHPVINVENYFSFDHSMIMLNGEDWVLNNIENGSMMSDTYSTKQFNEKLTSNIGVQIDSGDILSEMLDVANKMWFFDTEMVGGKKHLSYPVVQMENVSEDELRKIVSSIKESDFTMKSFSFSDENNSAIYVNRDDFNFTYKACAVDRGNGFLPLQKNVKGKETVGGLKRLPCEIYNHGTVSLFKYKDIKEEVAKSCSKIL